MSILERIPSPTPEEVIALRKSRGWTQTQAAGHWLTTINAVQKWEAPINTQNHRRVHPLMFWAMRRIGTSIKKGEEE